MGEAALPEDVAAAAAERAATLGHDLGRWHQQLTSGSHGALCRRCRRVFVLRRKGELGWYVLVGPVAEEHCEGRAP